ncbi:MAG: hypothetical protein OXF44_11700 [Anaerolineaceae bacterium]|nr:hypothetical protein [Anaerolineaceae bacterium]
MAEETIVAVFPSRVILGKALDHIGRLDDLALKHAVIIARARDGEIVVLDDDISSHEVMYAGAGLGAIMMAIGVAQQGALALPGAMALIALVLAALAGGLVGAGVSRAAATLIDSDFRNLQVKTLAAELKAGHPALVLEFEEGADSLGRLRLELKPYRAELVEYLHEARFAVARMDEGAADEAPEMRRQR